jgi:hypothetical protein
MVNRTGKLFRRFVEYKNCRLQIEFVVLLGKSNFCLAGEPNGRLCFDGESNGLFAAKSLQVGNLRGLRLSLVLRIGISHGIKKDNHFADCTGISITKRRPRRLRD